MTFDCSRTIRPRGSIEREPFLRPGTHPRSFEIAADAMRRRGELAGAEEAELSGIKASLCVEELDAAAVAANDGRGAEAQVLLQTFLAGQPANLLALTMAAELDIAEWKLDRAEQRLRTVLDRAPSFLRAIMLLGTCLSAQARIGEAITLFESVVSRKPHNALALRSLAQAQGESNRHEQAAETYRRLLDLDPSQVDIWVILAQELRMLGRTAESIAAFRRALAQYPDSGAAWWGLAYYFPAKIDGADIKTMERSLQNKQVPPGERSALHVALGILADRRGDREGAFRHISEGKALRVSSQPSDAAEDSRHLEELIGALTPELFAALGSRGWSDNAPIFIIGMPRSGTTLLERILSRHSHIEAAGELPIIARMASAGWGSSAPSLASMTGDELRKLGEVYLERSRDYRAGQKPRFVDKMNSNWFRVGLIRLMLPNAPIIDLRRNALDCCWSNFKMMFAEGTVAANDQRSIARFYRDYARMVDAVDCASGGGILKVDYESLVDDPEGETRRILGFLGLQYEASCIDFHLSTAAVATPSSEQVRRPINRDGIGSADPYRQWLGPMIEELGELAKPVEGRNGGA